MDSIANCCIGRFSSASLILSGCAQVTETHIPTGVGCNGGASDSRSEGCEFVYFCPLFPFALIILEHFLSTIFQWLTQGPYKTKSVDTHTHTHLYESQLKDIRSSLIRFRVARLCIILGRMYAHRQNMRMPGVEPGSQAWKACMIPRHYMRVYAHYRFSHCPLWIVSW